MLTSGRMLEPRTFEDDEEPFRKTEQFAARQLESQKLAGIQWKLIRSRSDMASKGGIIALLES